MLPYGKEISSFEMSSKQQDPLDIEVGRRVRSLRLEKGMSQEKLGNQLALTFQQIQKYENGTHRIGAARLQRIAQILGVSVSALYLAPVPARRNSQEVAELIDTGSTLRLLRAYSRMRSPSLQRALTTLVEEIAEKS
jgi:transcriptional regulator with XRE-family HTH domain